MALINGPVTRGDYIKVTHQDPAGNLDLLILGTAMQDINQGGAARFTVALPGTKIIGGAHVELSVNDVDVTLLFAADVAREGASA
ncbi:hypothetical protein ACWGJ9_09805 [Curtobacterium citreum]